MPTARVTRIPLGAPDDMSGLDAATATGEIALQNIVAIFGKTEGNGLVNDYSRPLAARALKDHLGDRADDVAIIMSGGTEGGLAPHLLVFERCESETSRAAPALAIGRARTPPLAPAHLGQAEQIAMVAEGVARAMGDAGIDNPDQVHFVQVKCPLLTADRIAAAEARGAEVAVRDTLKSMNYSRGASALGVAAALGEIGMDRISGAVVLEDIDLWSGRASTSAGIELLSHEIVVLAMSTAWSGPLAIDHAVMADALDVEPVREALARLGLASPGQLPAEARARVAAVLAKAEASRDGRLRGRRHVMNDDSDIASTRHARAFAGGALGALVGHGEIFVSGGAEHQGPDGGGPVAVIVKREI